MFCLYIQRLNTIKVSFTDVFRAQNARSKVRLNDLGVRKEVANCLFLSRGFKAKNMIRQMYLNKSKVVRDQKPRNKVQLIKMQQEMCKKTTGVVGMNQVECV